MRILSHINRATFMFSIEQTKFCMEHTHTHTHAGCRKINVFGTHPLTSHTHITTYYMLLCDIFESFCNFHVSVISYYAD